MGAGKKNVVIKSSSLGMGGREVILLNIVKNLDLKKYNVSLIITNDNGSNNVFLQDVPTGVDVYFCRPLVLNEKYHYYYGLRKRTLLQKVLYNYYIWKLTRVAKNKCLDALCKIKDKYGRVDVYIDFDGSTRRFIRNIDAKKKIQWRHESFKIIGTKKRTSRFFKYMEGYDKIVAICEAMRDEIFEYSPQLVKKACVAYNPIDLKNIKDRAELVENMSNEELELMKSDYIVTVSRLDISQKDYHTLIKAYKYAKEKGFQWKLYIIGDGVDRNRIQNLINANGLSDDIKMLGQKNNPFVFVKNSKFFILSSYAEGLPTVLIEALTLNVPIISSNCPTGPAEILENGKYGMLVPVGDAEAMSDRIMELYDNPEKCDKYRTMGSERAMDFSIENTMKVIEDIIED